ncbi:MAG: nucleotidyltransferase [Candidatus Delongbacteria bacterium]|nr:MAG: nucleotidyltransferase [Candidatus Delongbacteria bacterium]
MSTDIRWIQRYNQYCLAFKNLKEAIDLESERKLSKLEEQGLIKGFELVHELSWLMIKDFYYAQGETTIQGSRDAFRLAFKRGLIENGEIFMKSIKSRQLSVHTYNEETASQIHSDILKLYFNEFKILLDKFSDLVKSEID